MRNTRGFIRRRSRRRGQAMVELALCTILFVLIIMGGLYFGEIGMLSVKVTEASSAALWDATGRQAHAYEANGTLGVLHEDVATFTTSRIGAQYADFDGRDQPGAPPSLVLTTAGELEVTCEPFDVEDVSSVLLEYHEGSNPVYSREAQGGIRCQSTSQVSLIPGRSPRDFHTDSGWLSGPVLRQSAIQLCGVGRAWGGDCNDGTPIMLGDWGLSNPNENEHTECELSAGSGCANRGYYAAVEAHYDRYGVISQGQITRGSDFASDVVGVSPLMGQETKFWMSFRGEESDFEENLDTSLNRGNFTVTPGGSPHDGQITQYYDEYLVRRGFAADNGGRGCWLGMKCDDY